MLLVLMMHLLLLVTAFLECPEKTTLSMLRFLNLDLSVMVKLMEVTMLTLRLNVKHSTFAQLMEREVWPSTASSVLMVHSSTRTTSSVTGGSTLTAPLPRISTLSMMKLLLSVKPLQERLMLLVPMRHQLTMLLLLHLLVTTLWRDDEAEDLEAAGITGEGEGVKEEEVELRKQIQIMVNVPPITFIIVFSLYYLSHFFKFVP